MTTSRGPLAAAGAVVSLTVLLVAAGPAAAHGAGALTGLPLERWQYAWGVAAIVVIAFFAAAATWRRPVLDQAADGRPLPRAVQVGADVLAVAVRVVGVVLYVVIVTAGLFGSQFPAANIAPIAVFITLWIGVAFVSMLLGDVWAALSPFETIALVAARVRGRAVGGERPTGPATSLPEASHWFAAAVLAGFVWLEQAYHSSTEPRLLGWLGLGYGVVLLTGAARHGRGWLRTADGFAVLFGLFATMAPLHRDEEGRVRVRWPFTGLARLEVRDGTLPVLFVVLGAVLFDGLTRTTFWFDLTIARVGWGYTAVATLALAWTIGIVALVYLGVMRLVAALTGGDGDETAWAFAGVLVPIVAAFTVAHSFAILVFEGQGFWFLISNPYGEGWDLFGTDDGTVDLQLLSAATITWVQAAAIAVFSVGAVVVAHDRAVTDPAPRQAVAAQCVLLALVTGSAVAAVALLLGT